MRMRSPRKKRKLKCQDLLAEGRDLEVDHQSGLEKGGHELQLRPEIETREIEKSGLGGEIGIEVNRGLVAGAEIGAHAVAIKRLGFIGTVGQTCYRYGRHLSWRDRERDRDRERERERRGEEEKKRKEEEEKRLEEERQRRRCSLVPYRL